MDGPPGRRAALQRAAHGRGRPYLGAVYAAGSSAPRCGLAPGMTPRPSARWGVRTSRSERAGTRAGGPHGHVPCRPTVSRARMMGPESAGPTLNNRRQAASYKYADQPSQAPGRAPSWGYHLAISDGQDDIRQRVADRGRLGARFRGRHQRPSRAGGCMGPAHQFAARPADQPCPESAARAHRCVPGRPQQHRFASVCRDAVGTSRGRGGTRPVQHHHGEANPAAGPSESRGKALAELSISVDAADRHLLVYGYNDFHRMAVMNLSTGHLASITVTRPTIGSPFSCAAW